MATKKNDECAAGSDSKQGGQVAGSDCVSVGDGKYIFFMDEDGLLNCLRHGEAWPAFREQGSHLSGSTLALYQELARVTKCEGGDSFVREELALGHSRGVLSDMSGPLRDPLASQMEKSFRSGFIAACENRVVTYVLTKLRWRAHADNERELACFLSDLEYLVRNWGHPPTRELPLRYQVTPAPRGGA